MNNSPIDATGRRDLPLCRSHVCVALRASSLQVQSKAEAGTGQMGWALSILSNGQLHYLGSWWLLDQPACWQHIADDLNRRGIERLRFAIAPDPVELEAALAPLYSGVTVLPAFGKVLDQTLIDALHPGHRHYIERAHRVSTQLELRLKRAAARHGTFANAAAASALLRRSAERYIDTTRPTQAPRPSQAWRTGADPASAAVPITH